MSNRSSSTAKKIGTILSGMILVTLTVIATVSVASFDIQDPSFNNVTDSLPNNFFGEFGSYSADLFLQLFGIGSYMIILVPFAWGMQNITHYKGYSFFIKFIAYIITICLFLAIITKLTPSSNWVFDSYGGVVGTQLYVWIKNQEIPYHIYIGVSLFLLSFYFALGFRLNAWKAALIFIWHNIYFVFRNTWHVILTTFNIARSLTSKASKLRGKMLAKKAAPSPFVEDRHIAASADETPMMFKKTSEPAKPKAPKSTQLSFNDTSDFKLPGSDLLNKIDAKSSNASIPRKILDEKADQLTNALRDFGVNGDIIGVYPGPVVTLYEFEPAAGTKSSRVVGLADDIARTMFATSARIAVIPGKNSIGIELPNDTREIVYLRELVEDKHYSQADKKLPMILGKDISGNSIIADLAAMPHLLVAGTTGSGKSVAINTMILSLLYKHSPEECKFIMIDPKMLELSIYDGIPHLLAPVVTEPGKAVTALKWVVREMENRYRLMSQVNVRNMEGYNQKIKEAIKNNTTLERKVQSGFDPETGKPIYETVEIEKKSLPFIVVIVDEMADLMIVAGKEIEGSIQRLAQMARAAGIHIIMATQRPSVDVITGVIKANFPTRISFHVTSKVDSRTILGEMGAEQLLGKGDMLYMSGGSKIKRVHGPFVADSEVDAVVKFLKNQSAPSYSVDITEEGPGESMGGGGGNSGDLDDLYDQAVALVTREKKASTSYLQRYFKIGYNRAATIIDQLEQNGIVSAANHVGKREILANTENEDN
ncbi:MAG: DNA translocase FtsK 4TM domain-containing protein [Rickettsiales bacterium]